MLSDMINLIILFYSNLIKEYTAKRANSNNANMTINLTNSPFQLPALPLPHPSPALLYPTSLNHSPNAQIRTPG